MIRLRKLSGALALPCQAFEQIIEGALNGEF
jgi:hypothetical protein